MPAATAAAEPPLEPPGTRSRFHGLRVEPRVVCCVVIPHPNSCDRVTPAITAPAARSRCTTSASCSAIEARSRVGAVRVVGSLDIEQLLHTDRHAVQRSPRATTLRLGIRFLGLALGSFAQHLDERTELTVEPLDAIRRAGKLFSRCHRAQFWRHGGGISLTLCEFANACRIREVLVAELLFTPPAARACGVPVAPGERTATPERVMQIPSIGSQPVMFAW